MDTYEKGRPCRYLFLNITPKIKFSWADLSIWFSDADDLSIFYSDVDDLSKLFSNEDDLSILFCEQDDLSILFSDEDDLCIMFSDEDDLSARQELVVWLENMEKRIDFIYSYEEPEYSTVEQGEEEIFTSKSFFNMCIV